MNSLPSLPDFGGLLTMFGGVSPWLVFGLLTLMVLASWKIPGFSNSGSLRLTGLSLGAYFALGGIIEWLVTWQPSPQKCIIGFFAMLKLFSLGLAVFSFVQSLASARRTP